MKDVELKYFFRLKKEIGATLKQENKVDSDQVADWKGSDIVAFQEDLIEKVNGRISEKWFYTHIKSENEKLPRIDMLNMLSQYVGYSNWSEYKANNPIKIEKKPSGIVKKSNKLTTLLIPGVAIIMLGIFIFQTFFNETKYVYQFCFLDTDRKVAITDAIELELLKENESSVFVNCDPEGCVKIESDLDRIRFVVRSAYYKTDTIVRNYNEGTSNEAVKLRTNDYALMIHIFSKSEVSSWKERRKQLDEMIWDDARIYQIYSESDIAMEMYNKKEFINKLTMPTNSLKNIEIIETINHEGKIKMLRFLQREE